MPQEVAEKKVEINMKDAALLGGGLAAGAYCRISVEETLCSSSGYSKNVSSKPALCSSL